MTHIIKFIYIKFKCKIIFVLHIIENINGLKVSYDLLYHMKLYKCFSLLSILALLRGLNEHMWIILNFSKVEIQLLQF